MPEFTEGAQWTTYGHDGFADKRSMTLDIDGQSRTSVLRFNQNYVAINVLTGAVLSNIVELDVAVAVAEAEALSSTEL